MPRKPGFRWMGKDPINWKNPKRVKQILDDATYMRRIAMAQILEADPLFPSVEFVKKFKVNRRQITADLYFLRSNGNPGALERLKHFENMRTNQVRVRENVEAFVLANPNCIPQEIQEHLQYSETTVWNALKYLNSHRKNFKFTNWRKKSVEIRGLARKKSIMKALMVNPHATGAEVSKITGIPQATVGEIIQEMDRKLNAENAFKREIIKNYLFEELLIVKERCESRLNKIKSPTQGARLIELTLQSLKQIAQLHNIGGPETQLNVQVVVNKDQRDAAGQAVAESIVLKHDLKLPDFKGAGMDIVQ